MAQPTSSDKALHNATVGASAAPEHGLSHELDRVVFGKRLKAQRKALGWTLAQVAQITGVSITTISRAERGQIALGYEKFCALGLALQLDMGALFAQVPAQRPPWRAPAITRRGTGLVHQGDAFSDEYLGTPAQGQRLHARIVTVHARSLAQAQDWVQHQGEACVYVLCGTLAVHLENGDVIQMGTGDAMHLASSMAHACVCTSAAPAQLLAVVLAEPLPAQPTRHAPDLASA